MIHYKFSAALGLTQKRHCWRIKTAEYRGDDEDDIPPRLVLSTDYRTILWDFNGTAIRPPSQYNNPLRAILLIKKWL